MIYIKKIIDQDIQRTPTFNLEAINVFFNINLGPSETVNKNIVLLSNNRSFPVNFKRRETRNEYRIFLKDLFNEVNPTEGDILIFRKINSEDYSCEYIPIGHEYYNYIDHLFESSSNHELVTTEENQNQEINTLDKFIHWFDKIDPEINNYLNDNFSGSLEKLKENLLIFEGIYNKEFNSDIFSFKKENKEELINQLKENLYKESGTFFEFSSKKSNHMPRAILGKKNYLRFLQEFEIEETHIEQTDFELSDFQEKCKTAGLNYSNPLITRYVSSLATKPFVLLSGLSGSGKTKLAQAYAQWICESKEQYRIVPVGADWTNREPLLGYVNALDNKEYILPENGALKLIIEANQEVNQNKPYFLILDEMNLSHVERYFADFLSVMESNDELKLHSSESNLNITEGEKYSESIEVPSSIKWPINLFIIGTVNIDETTYMFSPKVLDRANVIEFRVAKDDLETYFKPENKSLDMKKLCKDKSDIGLGAQFGKSFVDKAKEPTNKNNLEKINKELVNFFEELQSIGAEFGYRTASEIQTLFDKIELISPDLKEKDDFKKLNIDIDNFKIDVAIMQKLLPKLHGSRNKLADVLKTLAKLCVINYVEAKEGNKNIFEEEELKIIYPISYEKLKRMHHNVITNGFTSYAEA